MKLYASLLLYFEVACAVKENEKYVCAISMRPYKYMGGYGPKEGKKRRKVHYFLSMYQNMKYRHSKTVVHLQSFIRKSDWGRKFSRAHVYMRKRARIPTAMLVFCCHKCHTRDRCRKKIVEKMAEKSTRESYEKCIFLVV